MKQKRTHFKKQASVMLCLLLVCCFALAGIFASSQTVYAAETGVVEVSTAEQYKTAISMNGSTTTHTIKLTDDIDISTLDNDGINIYRDLTIDLNGHFAL